MESVCLSIILLEFAVPCSATPPWKVAAKVGNVKISIKNILSNFFIVLLFFFRVLKKLVGGIFLRMILEK